LLNTEVLHAVHAVHAMPYSFRSTVPRERARLVRDSRMRFLVSLFGPRVDLGERQGIALKSPPTDDPAKASRCTSMHWQAGPSGFYIRIRTEKLLGYLALLTSKLDVTPPGRPKTRCAASFEQHRFARQSLPDERSKDAKSKGRRPLLSSDARLIHDRLTAAESTATSFSPP